MFDGYRFRETDDILITDEAGIVHDIVPIANAGDDIQQLSGILSPGLINCHCHLELSHLKNVIPPHTGLIDFLCSVVTKRGFDPAIIQQEIEKAEEEMYNNGIVAVGDIGNTSAMYAKTFFEPAAAGFNFDSVTVAPYMGSDSVTPFLNFKDKWVILLALTSNAGHADFQLQEIGADRLFEKVIKTSQTWATDEQMMYVVGATRGAAFGDVLAQPAPKVAAGNTVTVQFQSAHPRNMKTRGLAIVEVEKLDANGQWQSFTHDRSPELLFRWQPFDPTPYLSPVPLPGFVSTALAEWKIPANTPAGQYRIRHRGVAVPAGSPQAFEGVSQAFEVTATGATCSDGRTL